MMTQNIDAYFLHDFDRLGVDISGWVGTSTGDFDEITGCRTKDTFGKMTAAGIAGAEDKKERFWVHEEWEMEDI